MMKKFLLLIVALIAFNTAFAQPYKLQKKYAPYKWMIGVSWNVIEDDGNQLGDLFNAAESWNYLYYPTKITVDRYLKYGWSLEGAATYMKYEAGKRVNDTISLGSTFFAVDVNTRWSFNTLYAPKMRWLEPYVTLGLGYTYRSTAAVSPHVPTLNLGAGFNVWFHKNIGMQVQTSGKLGLWPGFWDSGLHSNYFHHSVGLMLRLHGKNRNSSTFNKRKHKWAHGNRRYKKNTGH
ncbi:MAG: hypothetical protein QNK23_18295 [Crocinitomicaceae bacterium]|nr:hypothetical protein [Crocinitomicaceae bacterium]